MIPVLCPKSWHPRQRRRRTTASKPPYPPVPTPMECLGSPWCRGVSYILYRFCLQSQHILPATEREFIGTFLLEMAVRQVISAQTEWYVDKTKLRQMFDAHLGGLPNSTEVRLKLSIQGAWNVSTKNDNILSSFSFPSSSYIYSEHSHMNPRSFLSCISRLIWVVNKSYSIECF